eukprot:5668210-Pyramimonas_sp.AAC.1
MSEVLNSDDPSDYPDAPSPVRRQRTKPGLPATHKARSAGNAPSPVLPATQSAQPVPQPALITLWLSP